MFIFNLFSKINFYMFIVRTAEAQCLRFCATKRKVAGSIPADVIDIKSLRPNYSSGVDTTSNRNEYREYYLGVKSAYAKG